MAQDRKKLGKIFRKILQNDNVYYSPPIDTKLHYPCIIYELSDAIIRYADNKPYYMEMLYTITYISDRADNQETVEKILQLPKCNIARTYNSDQLRHYIFNLYF